MSSPSPKRPRLAEHVFARRHIVNGRELVILHDKNSDRRIQLGLREWNIIASADGTRDLEGILLSAKRRGTFVKEPMLQGFFEQLQAAGLLAEGIPDEAAPKPPPTQDELGRPLEVLPDFSLHCDGQGSCCRLYSSVLFSAAETARARAFQPSVLDAGDDLERAFTPERGSLPGPAFCVALVNGRCAYLDDKDRCSLHAAGGPLAKPFGCSLFPALFIDDGETLRVSVEVECACVLASVGIQGGEPLVPAHAQTRADLSESVFVDSLPSQIRIGIKPEFTVPRARFVAWSRSLLEMLGDASLTAADPLALFWSLGSALDEHALSLEHTHQALRAKKYLDPAELRPWIEALQRCAAARASENLGFRAPSDLARLAVFWIERATQMLLDAKTCQALLQAPAQWPPIQRAHEYFYMRTLIFGHRLVDIDSPDQPGEGAQAQIPVSRALRDRALRLLVARCLPLAMLEADTGEPKPATDPAARFPLALVEAVIRGHALDDYLKA